MPPVILLHFREPAGVMPSDELGNLTDLGDGGILDTPTVVEAWTGRGRQFNSGGDVGFIAEDAEDRDTILTRDVTVQALLSLGNEADFWQTIICRGTNDGTASERYAYGLQLRASPLGAQYIEVRWFHMDSSDVLQTAPVGVFETPGEGVEFLLTATRRWESSSSVVVRYYVNDTMIAELDWAAGDISGGTLGHTTVGVRVDDPDVAEPFDGILDELLVCDHEMSPESVRETWRRLSAHQPAGVQMFAGLVPPGLPWVKDPGNSIGRFAKFAGVLLGMPIAAAEALRALWLPDASDHEQTARWERVFGIAAKPRDWLDKRRDRVLAFAGREEGFQHPAVKETLATAFDLDESQIEIDEFTNTIEETFDTLEPERWHIEDPANWTVAGGELVVEIPATTDLRWATKLMGQHIRTPIDPHGGRIYVQAELTAISLTDNGSGIGLMLCNRRTSHAIWFGVYRTGGANRIGYRVLTAHTVGAFVDLAAAPAAPLWFRLFVKEPDAGDVGADAKDHRVTLAYSSTGPSTGFSSSAPLLRVGDLEWAGFAAFGDDAALSVDHTASFASFTCHVPESWRPFHWYAFRDPALPGEPDMIGARLLVQKTKPAHTVASAIQSRSLLCDDESDGLCNVGCMGGL